MDIISEILGILTVIVLSAIKFITGVGFAIIFFKSTIKFFITITFGGGIGILLFVLLNEKIVFFLEKRSLLKKKKTKRKKKAHTKRNRFIIKIVNRFGLIGISILTPILLTIPIGTFLAVKYYNKRSKILATMLLFLLMWAIIFSILFHSYYDYFYKLLVQ